MSETPSAKLRALIREMSEKADLLKQLTDEGLTNLSERKIQNLDKDLAEIADTLAKARFRLDPAKHEIIEQILRHFSDNPPIADKAAMYKLLAL